MKLHPHDPTFSDSLPRFTKEQQDAVEKALAEPSHAILNASEPGVGKTGMTSEIIHRAGWRRVLIVGIKDTDEQWREALADQSDGKIQMRKIDGTKQGKANLNAMLSGEAGVFFAGMQYLVRQDWDHRDVLDPVTGEPLPAYDRDGQPTGKIQRQRVHLKTYAKMPKLDAFVTDEVHMLAGNRKAVGRRTLMSIPMDWKIALSGTWYGNKFENAWSITRWLWPELIDGSFHRWKDEWCAVEMEEIYVGGKAKEVENILGERNPGEFVQSLPCYIRIETEPAPAPKLVFVELSPEQRAQYTQMEEDMLVWLRQKHPGLTDEQLIPLVAEVEISKRQRLRTIALGEMTLDEDEEVQFEVDCKSSKMEALSGLIRFYGKQKVVMVTHSKRFAKVVVARMKRAGLGVAEWSGDVASAERDAIKQSFLTPLDDGGLQYLVAVTQAFGTGLDGFQTVCSKLIQLSEVEGNAVIEDQMVRRIWRRGVDKDNYEHVKIIAKDTYDEGVLAALKQRSQSMRVTMRMAA